MNLNNVLISNEKNELIYIGTGLPTGVLRSDMSNPLGYSSGQMMADDCFLLFLPDASALSDDERKKIQCASGAILPEQGCVILIAVYRNLDAEYLLKTFSESDFVQQFLLDTVFYSHEIVVEQLRNSSGQIRIRVDSQEIQSTTDGIAAVIFHEKGIRYFRTENAKSSNISIGEILDGAKFPAFWDQQRMYSDPIPMAEAINPEFLHAIKALEEGEKKVCVSTESGNYIIEGLSMSPFLRGRKAWVVHTEKNLMSLMSSSSEAYTMLQRGSLTEDFSGGYTFGLWGQDENICRIRLLLQKGAVTNTTILLTGESGTGKTYLAREIHKYSRRNDKPFVYVNCAAIPYNLLESELFGYEEGAFTGAKKGGRQGYFQMAEGGTLFLDEIAEVPLTLQGKLLEAIQSKTFFPVGGNKKVSADVRIIAATNKKLEEQVAKKRFREDLYYRINVFPIDVPPLRDRMDSIGGIVAELLPQICERLGVGPQIASAQAMKKIRSYHWPGNIRELENILEKACILSDGKVILAEDIDILLKKKDDGEGEKAGATLKARRADFEKKVIEEALRRNKGSRTAVAKELGIGRTCLYEKMDKYGIANEERTAE